MCGLGLAKREQSAGEPSVVRDIFELMASTVRG